MEFLTNLFWFPLNLFITSLELIVNVGLWAFVVYVIYEAIKYWKEKLTD